MIKKYRRLLAFLALVLVVSSTIAYSALTASVKITAGVKLRAVSDIRVTDIVLSSSNGAVLQYDSNFDLNTISSGFTLPTTDASITYKVQVTNNGTIDQTILEIGTQSSNNQGLYYTVSGYETRDVIDFKTVKEFYITYKTTTPSNETINVVNNFVFRKVYHVSYDTNGGTPVAAQNKIEGESLTLSTAQPIKSGYIFEGWTDVQGGTTVKYSSGASYTIDRDVILYAVYSYYPYQLEYELNHGYLANGVTNPVTYTINTPTFTLNNPQKTVTVTGNVNNTGADIGNQVSKAQTFKGWSGPGLTGDSNTTVIISKGSAGDRTYTANWTPVAMILPTATKNGYTCKWNTKADGTGTNYNSGGSYTPTANSDVNIELFARCTANNYTITYNLGGGTVSPANPTSYTIESNEITLNNPTRNGYTFAGWTGSNGDTPQTTVKIAAGSTGNKTYTANWNANTYTITYILGGGTVSPPNPTNYTILSGEISLNPPSKTGYTFTGWTGSNGNTPQKNVRISTGSTGNRTYTANYSANDYIISLDTTYATNTPTQQITATYNSSSLNPSTITLPEQVYTISGFGLSATRKSTGATVSSNSDITSTSTFEGWYTSEIGGTKILSNSTTPVLQASVSGYTDANGKWIKAGEAEVYARFTRPSKTLPTITKTGYICGWTTNSTGTTIDYPSGESITISDSGELIDNVLNLYGVCVPRNYTVTADANGGSIPSTSGWTGTGNTSTKSVTYDSQYGTLPTPTRTGYTFQGWKGKNLINNSDKNITYTNNYYIDEISNPKYELKANTDYVLTFNYIVNSSSRNLSASVGYGVNSFSKDIANVAYDNSGKMVIKFTTPATFTTNPHNVAFRFARMYPAGNANVDISNIQLEEGTIETPYEPYYVTSSVSVTQAKDHTLRAIWKENVYSITLDKQSGSGGTGTIYEKYNTGYYTNSAATTQMTTSANPITKPTRTGYTFKGYYTSVNGGGVQYIDQNGNLTSNASTTQFSNNSGKLYAFWKDEDKPSASITSTSNLKQASQTLTLKCSDSVAVTGYYYGTSAPTSNTTYTTTAADITSLAGNGLTKTASAAGTYYLSCKDGSGNVETKGVVLNSYKVVNMLNNVSGSTYTTTDYTKASEATYIAPTGTSITLGSVYTVPTGSNTNKFKGYSEGAASTTATTVSNTAPTLASNTTYTMWFTRNIIYVKYKTNGGTLQTTTHNADNTVTYTWGLDSNNYITINNTNGISSFRYGVTTIDLANYNSREYMYMYKNGYKTTTNQEWICESGCTTANKVFSHNSMNLNSSNDMCNASSNDCTIVVKVNWNKRNYTLGYTLNGGTVSSDNLTSYSIDSNLITLNNPTKTGYTFTDWTEQIKDLVWNPGFVNATTGIVETSSSYPNSYYTDMVRLQSGKTYTISGNSNYSDIRWRIYNLDGTYKTYVQGSSYTPDANYYVRILYFNAPTSAQMSGTIISSNQGTSATIPSGSTHNRTYVANFSGNEYSIGYTLNGGTKGTNKPTSAIYGNDVQISNPTKTFTVNINANGQEATIKNAGGTAVTSASSTQTFTGWTSTTIGGNALTGTAANPSTSWNGSSTKNTYFKNLKETGEVVLVANFSAANVTLPNITKSGYTCGYSTTASGNIVYNSGATYTPDYSQNAALNNTTLFAKCIDNIKPVGLNITNSSNGVYTNQNVLITLSAVDEGTGINRYEWYENGAWTTRALSTSDGIGTITYTADRNLTIRFRAIDNAGNISDEATTVVKIDKTAPTIVSATASSDLDLRNYVDFNATDSGSKIVGYNISTSTTAPTTWIPVVSTVETTTETKYDHDAAWARVFHHNNHYGSVYYSSANSGAEAQSSNTVDKYSVLGSIANYKNTNNWEFLLEYPNVSATGYNRWIQTSNPITSNNTITGYEAKHIDWATSAWNGIALSSQNTSTFIDGSPTAASWYYAIGAYVSYRSAMPGPSEDKLISTVNLWSRIDNLTTTTSDNLTRRIGDIKTDGTYYVWVKDSVGNTKSEAITISNVDTAVPTVNITSTNNVAASQTATLTLGDNKALDKYYWGTSNPASSNLTYTTITNNPTSSAPTKTVSSGGTYYVSVVDKAGNRTITNKTFYKTDLIPGRGTVTPTSVVTMSGNEFTIPTPSSVTGYTFNGWYKDSEFTTSAGTKYKPTANTTLYGKWTATPYTITTDLRNGSVGTANPTSYTIESSAITLNNPTRSGYTFLGWTGSNGNTPQTTVTIAAGSTGNKSYTANWSKAVTSLTITISPESYVYDGNEKTPTVTVKDGSTTLTEGTDYTVTYLNNVNVGNSTTKPTVRVTGKSAYNSGTKSIYTGTKDIEFAITQSLVVLSPPQANTATLTYNGNAQTISGTAGSCGPFATMYYYTKNYTTSSAPTFSSTSADWSTTYPTAKATNAGTYHMWYYCYVSDTTNNTGTGINTAVDITKVIERQAVAEPSCTSATYDGTTKTLLAASTSGGYTNDAITGITAGNYSKTLTLNSNYKWSSGSNVTSNRTKTCSIGKKNITITAKAQTVNYGTAITKTPAQVTVATLATGDTLDSITLVQSTTNATTNGTITPSAAVIKNGSSENVTSSYNITAYNTGKLTINKVNATCPTLASYTGVNDGSGHSITVTGSPVGGTLNYSTDSGSTWSTTNPSISSLGTTTVFVKVAPDSNHNEVSCYVSGSTKATVNLYNARIDFDYNGGSLVTTSPAGTNPIYVQKNGTSLYNTRTGTSAGTIPTVRWNGYTFTGWYTEASGGKQVITDANVVKASVSGWTDANKKWLLTSHSNTQNTNTLYARWTPTEYGITYDLQGGSVSTANPTSYTIESSAITLNNPTKTGYTFKGWTGSNSSSPQTTVTIPAGSTGDKAYVANWQTVNYTITYDLAGGSVSSSNPESYTIESNAITLNNPTRTGYDFAGWTGSNGSTAQTTVTIAKGSTGNKTYTANWTAKKYTITLDSTGATNTPTASIKATYNTTTISDPATITVPTQVYTISGFGLAASRKSDGASVSSATAITNTSTFNGWYTSSTGGSKLLSNGTTPVLQASISGYTDANSKWIKAANTTVYARFTKNSSTLPTITKTGYVCGWTRSSTGTTADYASGETITITDPSILTNNTLTLYGVCVPNTYTVKYNGNTNTGGATANSTHTYDVAKNLTANGFTKTNYTFSRWNTKADGTGTSYTNSQSVTNLTSTNGATFNLYAQWNPNVYTVTLDKQSGSGGTSTIYEKYNTGYYTNSAATTEMTTSSNPITIPTRSGYNFKGYYTAANGGGTQYISADGKLTSSASTTNFTNNTGKLYAFWQDEDGPTVTLTSSANLKQTSQTLTLKCTDTAGVTGYYYGPTAPTSSTTYTTTAADLTSLAGSGITKTETTAGTYYLSCTDGIHTDTKSVTLHSYRVINMLNNVSGSTYTTTHYTSTSDNTYIAPKNTTLTLSNIRTVPTGSNANKFKGYSSGEPSTTAATMTTTNPSLTANSIYTLWFTRNIINVKFKTNGGTLQTSTHTADGATTYAWTLNSSDYITLNSNNGILNSWRYGTSSMDLVNYNNMNYLYIYRNGYTTTSNQEWICESGCTTANQVFPHANNTTAPCDASSNDCTAVLKVNWVRRNYTLGYTLNGGSVSSANPTSYNYDSDTIALNNPTRSGYTFDGWTEQIKDLVWNPGFVNINTGIIETNSSYLNSYYTDMIRVKSGLTYTLSGYGSYSASNIRWRIYNLDGTYLDNLNGQTYTPNADYYVRIMYFNAPTSAQMSGTVITSTPGTTVSIPAGSTHNRTYTANWSKAASSLTITLDPTSYTYDGTAKTPTVTVKDGSTTLTKDTDYTIAYSNNTNAGTAKVTVTGKGVYNSTTNARYTGSKEVSFTIARQAIAFPTCTAKTYSGSSQTLFAAHTSGTYTNTALSGTNADSYTVDLTPTANYQWSSGSNVTSARTLTCTINKYTPSVALSPTSGSVEWDHEQTFTATPTTITACKGTLTAASSSTTYVTISSGASTSNATSAVTVKWKGKLKNGSTSVKINVDYTPTDTDNCNVATQKQYTPTVTEYTPVITYTPVNTNYTASAISANTATVDHDAGATIGYEYYNSSDCSGTALSGAPKDVGEHSVNVIVPAVTNKTLRKTQCFTHTITKSNTTTSMSAVTKTFNNSNQAASGATAKLSSNSSAISGAAFTYEYYSSTDCSGTKLSAAPKTAGSYSVKAILTGTSNYNTSNKCATYTMNKYKPSLALSAASGSVAWNSEKTFTATPTVITACKGTLTAASASTTYVTISSGASTTDATSAVTVKWKGVKETTGTKINVNYKPTDTDNCLNADQKQYTATVTTPSPTVTLTAKTEAQRTYTGSAIAANTATVSPNSSPTITYKYYTNSTCTTGETTTAPTNVGTYYVKAYAAAVAGKTDAGESGCINHSIVKSNTTTSMSAVTKTFNNSNQAASGATAKLSSNSSAISGGSYTYTYYSGGSCSGTALSAAPKTAGSYSVKATLTGTSNYNTSTSECVTYTMNKYKPTLALSATTNTIMWSQTKTFTATPTTITACKGTLTAASANTSYITISSGASTEDATSAVTVKWKGVLKTTGIKINVNYAPTDTTNCASADQKQYTGVVNVYGPITVNLTAKSATYTGSAIAANTATATPNSSPTMSYTYYTNDTCTTKTSTSDSSGAASAGAAPKNAGTYYVIAHADAVSNKTVAGDSDCTTHTITKKKPTMNISPTSGTLTYGTNGTITVTTDGDGTISCSTSDGTVVGCSTDNTTKKITVTPKANTADGKTATITVKQAAGTNYSAADNKTYSVTVNRKTITCPTATSSQTKIYTGSSITSGVSCPTGSTAGGTTSATNVGSYSHTCEANSGYKFASACSVAWSINNAKITFNKGTCDSISGSTALYAKKGVASTLYTGAQNTTAGTIPTASKTGYTFNGWYTGTSSGTKVINSDKSVVASISNWTDANKKWLLTDNSNVNAHCTANNYTIVFDPNGANEGVEGKELTTSGGGLMSNLAMTYGTAKELTANAYYRYGYRFTGWNTKSDGTGTSYADGASVNNLTTTANGTVTLYARWTIQQVDITINPNGGTWNSTTDPSTVTKNVNDKYLITHTKPTKTGYKFNGYSGFSAMKPKYLDENTSYSPNLSSDAYLNNTKIFPYNNISNSTTTYYNGTTVTNSGSNYTKVTKGAAAGNTITIDKYINTAYEEGHIGRSPFGSYGFVIVNPAQANLASGAKPGFGGFYQEYSSADTSTSTEYIHIVGAICGYDSKSQATYLHFNHNSLGGGSDYASSGYGWITPNWCKSSSSADSSWKIYIYKLKLGSSSPGTFGHIYYTPVAFNGTTDLGDKELAHFSSNVGYSGVFRVTSSNIFKNYKSSRSDKIAITLTAGWKAITYTVKYNGNNNTGGSTASSTHTYDVAKALTSNGFTRTGYKFSKWNTKADGTGTNYTNGQSVTNLTSTSGGTVNLYAQWTAQPVYAITLDRNNGSGGTGTIYVRYNTGYYRDYSNGTTSNQMTSSAHGISIPSRTNYKFLGYYTTASGGTQYIGAGGFLTSSASTTNFSAAGTLYAHWKLRTYSCKFNYKYCTRNSTSTPVNSGTCEGTICYSGANVGSSVAASTGCGSIGSGWAYHATTGSYGTCDCSTTTALSGSTTAQSYNITNKPTACYLGNACTVSCTETT